MIDLSPLARRIAYVTIFEIFAILFAILSFIGFEATAVFRDEAKDPDRTIPRATYIALGSIGAFYAVSSWLLISANGESTVVAAAEADAGTLLATTAERPVIRAAAVSIRSSWRHF